MKLIRCLNSNIYTLSLGLVLLALGLPTLRAQDTLPHRTAANGGLPPSMQQSVQVMVELKDAPASATYAAALKQAQAQYDAQRNNALQHPNTKTSQAILKQSPTSIQISSTGASQVKTAISKIDSAQKSLLSSLTGANIGGKVMFRAQRAYNGIAMIVSRDKIAAIPALPGAKAVHPITPNSHTATFSDIDFVGGRTFWNKTVPFGGVHGENIKVADIDSGLDYIHTNFGGPGSGGYALVPDHTVAPNAFFPTPKVPGGYDFAGDNYDANSNAPANAPMPDPDPFDFGRHRPLTA